MRELTRERWQKVDALFAAALEKPAAARLAFLAEACGEDAYVYEEVVALLELDDEAERVLGDSAEVFAEPVLSAAERAADPLEEKVPPVVGPYRILSQIGSGGMGRVFLAERSDKFFTRTVALKLVRRGLAADHTIERFRSEQQIQAKLEHPSIARLYDAGATDEGWPYLAMEYVAGRPIDEHCDHHRLTVEARIRLFVEVCRAVQYAHQNLVVHRDIKPSNIAVTETGEVKLLDFGIAKLLEDPTREAQDALTHTGLRLMTPEYAAPEQAQGGAATIATDVYSLGVVLYELLTGRRPFDLKGKSPWEAQRILLDEEPRRPSTAVQGTRARAQSKTRTDDPLADGIALSRATTPARLRRRLRGELDTILLTALQKDPGRRYATVDAFQDDLERFLSGEPVHAQPDTALYRARKFVRRHRWGVTVAGSFVTLLAVFAVATSIQLAATSEQRDQAAQALAKSEQVMVFMTDLFREADPLVAQGDTLNVYQLLERASRRAEVDLGAQPDLYAAILQTIGTVYLNLAEYDTAAAMLNRALVLHQTSGSDRVREAGTMELLGRVYRDRGDVAQAVAMNDEALALRRRIQPAIHPDIATSLSELGISLHRNGDLDRAEAVYGEAITAFRQAGGENAGLADALENLGVLRHDVGHVAEAEPIFREALTLAETHYGPTHPKVGMTLSSLASTLQLSGNLIAAESLFIRALDIHRNAFGDINPNVSLVLNNLATLYDEQGAHLKADSLYRLAIRTDSQLQGADHPDVAISRHNYGLMLLEEGRLREAEDQIRTGVDILRATLSDDHLYTAILSGSLGLVVCENGRFDEGERILRAGIATMREQLETNHWRIAVANRNLGVCLLGSGDWDEAEMLLRESHARLAEERGDDARVAQEAAEWLRELERVRGGQAR
jgi:serine/threonine-protein kinase